MGWIETSYMARRGDGQGPGRCAPPPDRGGPGQVPLRLRPLCRARAADPARRPGRGRDPRRVRGVRSGPRRTCRRRCSTCPSSTRRTARSRSRGREKGDVLAVHIQGIRPRGPQPVGTTALIPEFGGLVATPNTALLNAPAARAGQEDGGDRGRASGSTTRSPCPTSRSSARWASRPRSRRSAR